MYFEIGVCKIFVENVTFLKYLIDCDSVSELYSKLLKINLGAPNKPNF